MRYEKMKNIFGFMKKTLDKQYRVLYIALVIEMQ